MANQEPPLNEKPEAFAVNPEPPIVLDMFAADPHMPLDLLVQQAQAQYGALLNGATLVQGKVLKNKPK